MLFDDMFTPEPAPQSKATTVAPPAINTPPVAPGPSTLIFPLAVGVF